MDPWHAKAKWIPAFAGMTGPGIPPKLCAPQPPDIAMARWIKLPDSRFIDANRVAFIGKVDTFQRIDEDGNDLGLGYAVYIGTDFPRESQISVTGSKDEVFAVLKQLLGNAPAE